MIMNVIGRVISQLALRFAGHHREPVLGYTGHRLVPLALVGRRLERTDMDINSDIGAIVKVQALRMDLDFSTEHDYQQALALGVAVYWTARRQAEAAVRASEATFGSSAMAPVHEAFQRAAAAAGKP